MAEDSAVDRIKEDGKEDRKSAGYSGLLNSALSKQAAYQDYYASLQDASNKSSLLNQGAEIDLLQGSQKGSYDILDRLLSSGYIDPETRKAIFEEMNYAGGLAADYSQYGGFDPETMDALIGEYMNARGKANTLAERGGLTTEEYQRILNSGRNDMMRQGRNAAESTFNQMNQGSPFAAGALMAQSAADTGAEMVKQRADLDKYQSDTRIKGNEQLSDLLSQAIATLSSRADNKGKGLDYLNQIIAAKSDVAGKSNSFSDALAGSAQDTLSNLVSFNDQYNKKGQYTGTKTQTPYSNKQTPWELNNEPYAPGFVEYGAGQKSGVRN